MKDNMNGKVNWNVFAYRFEDREQVTFEELCYQLFCRKFDLKEGLHRFYNQHYIETEPARISETRVVGFQAKYFESKVINDNQKKILKETIEKAAVKYPEMTELFFYITSEFSESSKPDQTKTDGQIAIEECAREHGIKLEWVMRSNLEVILQGEEYRSIWNYYFNPDPAVEVSNKTDFKEFYEYAIDKITTYKRNSLYGDISLEDGYIDPYIIDGERIKLKDYLFNWVADKNTDIENRVLIIFGEPGHGKTSLCYKAMYDYIKEGWLSYIVDNVFCFSLNPSDTELNPRDKFDLKKVLCWGDLRENHVSIKSCKNALVFLDGFDELLDSMPNLKLSELIQGPVLRFVKATKARVVITTRRMSIERELNSDLRIIDATEYPTLELQPMSYNQQVEWIENYASYCEEKASERDDVGSDLVKKASDLRQYLQKYIVTQKDLSAKTKELLAIPIIFRIMVEFQYDSYEFTDSAKLYEDLFNLTWDRRAKLISESEPANKKELTLANIAKHALRCYENDSDSALADIGLKDSDYFWTYQFYTKSIDTKESYNSKKAPRKLRIGFIHRSFYQFFLAKYIILAILDSRSKDELKAFMAHLTRNRLDKATLRFLKELFGLLSIVDQEYVRDRLEQVYQIIGDTDAILKETDGMEWVKTDTKSGIVSKLEAGSILFWNTLSLCSLLECRFDSKYREIYALRCYSLEHIDLSRTNFENANFNRANLSQANLCFANLKRTSLNETKLRRAFLDDAELFGASLYRADLCEAILIEANLCAAYLNEANLHEANLFKANLRGANLCAANLSNADLTGADFTRADLREADLSGADLRGAILNDANLVFNNISRAKIDIDKKALIEASILGYETIIWEKQTVE